MVTCQAAHADDAPQPLQDIYKIIECGSENLISFCTGRKLNEIVVKVKNRSTYYGGNILVSNTMLIGNHLTKKLKVCCLTPTVYHLTASSCYFLLDCMKLLPDIFQTDLLLANLGNDCSLLFRHIFDQK